MPEDSAGYHEPLEQLGPNIRDMHRAVVSVVEELQAIDWYAQRVAASQDSELRAILQHNADEEKEHAAMLLEWIRRHDPTFEAALRKFLFRSGSIVAAEEHGESAGNANGGGDRASIGSLREVRR
ncbi:MAG TPA: encapsulin-associated ferritin-like protein [Candidatus Binatia bacterium]|nr:encapsulin-associated ferritin-like protein [Candidatus Binatia bacterium]